MTKIIDINKPETCKLKANDNIPTYKFCLGNASKDFINNQSIETLQDGIMCEFSVDYSLV